MVEAALAAGQGEERIDELSLVLARVDGLLAGGSERVEGDGRVGQSHLEEGLAQHQRGAQFVGGVGDEASLGVERRFETSEEPVDGVAEVLELGVRPELSSASQQRTTHASTFCRATASPGRTRSALPIGLTTSRPPRACSRTGFPTSLTRRSTTAASRSPALRRP